MKAYRLSETRLKALYTLESDGTFKLSTRCDNGTDASVSRWMKGS